MATPERNFGLDDWQYTPARLNSFIENVARGGTLVKDELELALKKGGGKAFGLKICEQIAARFAAVPLKMQVPNWKIVEDIKTTKLIDNIILRSSAETEDWLDGRSGTSRSFAASDSYSFDYLQERDELPQIPFVSQQYRSGLGLVIDIGYSTLLHRIVTRIAVGNERFSDGFSSNKRRGEFTSAADDTEASVGMWEAETGYPVLPIRGFGRSPLSLYKEDTEYPNIIIRPLFNAVRRAGIDFGVQMELIVHPDDAYTLQLVQVRPTPTKVYQPILFSSSTTEGQQSWGKIIAQSAITNSAFDVTGEAFFFGRKGLVGNFEMIRRQSRRVTQDGKIGVYDERDDRGVSLDYSKAAQVYYGGYLAGSDVQLTPVAIRPNTHHGRMVSPIEANYYATLDEHCGMVSLRELEVNRIKAIAEQSDKPLKLRVVSDGLIAQIRLIE